MRGICVTVSVKDMVPRRLQNYFFGGLVLTNIVLVIIILRPFLGAVTLGATFAVLFHPLYLALLRRVGGQQSVAALLTTIIIMMIVISPLLLLGYQIFLEGRDLYFAVNDTHQDLPTLITGLNEKHLGQLSPWIASNLSRYLSQILERSFQQVGAIFSGVAHLMLNLLISLLALYYLLKDGSRLRKAVINLSPLLDRYDKNIFIHLHKAVTSVVFGSLAIAVLQGLSTGLGLYLFGIPNAAFWGAVGVLASLIPTVGTAIVIIPAAFYLILTDHFLTAIGLVIWGMTAVGLIDNIWGPKFIERGLHIHPFLILLAVLGGLTVFGPLGFLIGPLILSLMFALLDIYPLIMQSRKHSHLTVAEP